MSLWQGIDASTELFTLEYGTQVSCKATEFRKQIYHDREIMNNYHRKKFMEAGRSEPWPSGELRGPRGSSVAPGGAQGELSRPRQSDLRGSTVTPGELGRFALCGFLAPGGCATALSSLYYNFFFLPHAPHGLRFPAYGPE